MAEGFLGRLRHRMDKSLATRRAGRSGGVVVAYAPERDGDPDPGEVVWAWVPYEEDATKGKDRPVLVLGHDGDLLVGVPLSSRPNGHRRDAADWLPVGTGAWDRRSRPSYADTGRLLRMAPHDVRREGAALDRTAFDRVVVHVAEGHGWAAGGR